MSEESTYEAEARELCRIRGLDPDELISFGPGIRDCATRIELLKKECRAFAQLRQAFDAVERNTE